MSDKLKALADKLVAARLERDDADKMAEEMQALYDKAEAAMTVAMTDAEVASFKTDDGISISMRRSAYWQCKPDDKEQLFEALRKESMGDLIREEVNSNRLNAALRERTDQSPTGKLPESFSFLGNPFEKTIISIRGLY